MLIHRVRSFFAPVQTQESRKRDWAKLRDEALFVVALTRRSSGLWMLPTCEDEIGENFARAGTPEAAIRKNERFGTESITVTYWALESLHTALGTKPPFYGEALIGVGRHSSPDGGYGTVGQGKDIPIVNSTARHTAMALLLRLTNSPPLNLSELIKEHGPTVQWLLKYQRPSGGWSHEKTQPEPGLGYMTTAAAIAALCRFLRLAREFAREGEYFAEREISQAISSAYSAAIALANKGVWVGAPDGIPDRWEVRDSSFALHLLVQSSVEDDLHSYLPQEISKPIELLTDFVSLVRSDGWPARLDDTVSSLNATVSALGLIAGLEREDALPKADERRTAEELLVAALRVGEFKHNLTMWDWAALLRLASKRSGPIKEAERNAILSTAKQLRNAWMQEALYRHIFRKLPSHVRRPLFFALTNGRTNPPRSAISIFLREVIGETNRGFVTALIAAVFLAVLTAIAQHFF